MRDKKKKIWEDWGNFIGDEGLRIGGERMRILPFSGIEDREL